MFFEFFYKLRAAGVPAGTGEFLDLLRALTGYGDRGQALSPTKFYFVSRACLAKDEKYFDSFDRVFAEMFRAVLSDDTAFLKFLEDLLAQAKEKKKNTNAPGYEPDELWKELEERLRQQDKRHDGGSRWIGTGGASPFGNAGANPAGVRMGGTSGARSAIDSLESRRYREYSDEEKLGVRGFKIALRKLRDLRREGRPEFDLPASILKTSESGGDPTAIFRPSRKNRMSLILLTDVGGSMTPHSSLVSRLFTAASKIMHFREFKHYYFHNALYEFVFEDSMFRNAIPIDRMFKKFDPETRLIFAGDACMNPYELFDKRHAFFEFYYRARKTDDQAEHKQVMSAFERLAEIARNYPHRAWLNPEPRRSWWHETISAIAEVIPMYPLTLGGLRGAVSQLMRK